VYLATLSGFASLLRCRADNHMPRDPAVLGWKFQCGPRADYFPGLRARRRVMPADIWRRETHAWRPGAASWAHR